MMPLYFSRTTTDDDLIQRVHRNARQNRILGAMEPGETVNVEEVVERVNKDRQQSPELTSPQVREAAEKSNVLSLQDDKVVSPELSDEEKLF